MQVCTLASSSSGNCTLVREGETYILIDAGISMRRICCRLKELNIDPGEISAVFITHEHTDHICGIPMLTKKYGTPVYAPETVAKNTVSVFPELFGKIAPVPVGEYFTFGCLDIRAFHTPHDTEESVGYKITNGDKSFALATDMGHVSEEVLRELIGVNAAVLEANHDITMLKNGPYPFNLKKRILSDYGHMSNRLCGRLCGRLFEYGASKVILGHLSKENNTPELAYSTVKEQLAETGGVPGDNIDLYVAPRVETSAILDV